MATFPVSLTVDNPGAETVSVGGEVGGNWTAQIGALFDAIGTGTNALTADAGEPSPNSGNNCFTGDHGATAAKWMYQDISVPATDGLQTDVDVGDIIAELKVQINGKTGSFHEDDFLQIGLEMFDSGAATTLVDWAAPTSQAAAEPSVGQVWREITMRTPVPTDTRTIRLHVRAFDGFGSNLEVYFDDFTLDLIQGVDVFHTIGSAAPVVVDWTVNSGTLVADTDNVYTEPFLRYTGNTTYDADISFGSMGATVETAIDADEMTLDLRWNWVQDGDNDRMSLEIEFINAGASVIETIRTEADPGQLAGQNSGGPPMPVAIRWPVPSLTRTIKIAYLPFQQDGTTCDVGPSEIFVGMFQESGGRVASQIEFDIVSGSVSSGETSGVDFTFPNLAGHDIEAVIAFYNRATADDTAVPDGAIGMAFARRSLGAGHCWMEMQDGVTTSSRGRHGSNTSTDGTGFIRLSDTSSVAMELDITFGEGKVTLTPDATDNDVTTGITLIGIAAEDVATDIEGDVYRSFMGASNDLYDGGITEGFWPTIDLNTAWFNAGEITENGGDAEMTIGMVGQIGAPANRAYYQDGDADSLLQGGVFGALNGVIDPSDTDLDATRVGYFNASGLTIFNVMFGATGGFNEFFENHLLMRLGNLRSRVMEFDTPTATGNHAVTGVGFTPGLVIMITQNGTPESALNGNATALSAWCHGMMTANEEGCRAGYSAATTGASDSYQNGTALALYDDDSGTPILEGTFVSMDSDGFTINFTTVDASAFPVTCLVVEEGTALNAPGPSTRGTIIVVVTT